MPKKKKLISIICINVYTRTYCQNRMIDNTYRTIRHDTGDNRFIIIAESIFA